MRTFANPIVPGCHPDPSVCRVGRDGYLVTSSFEYFPGIPSFHGRDLVHWRQIGHVLGRKSQLDLRRVRSSRGICAATVRYARSRFYVIATAETPPIAGRHGPAAVQERKTRTDFRRPAFCGGGE